MPNQETEDASRIIFEDENISVIWLPGASDFLLISFGNLVERADGTTFFGKAPALKLGLSTIGVMAKGPNWYPPASLERALPTLRPYLEAHDDRITYGASMGGYAAIKFSRLLGAARIVALVPQWSIDPAECEGNKPGWPEHFVPSMAGMGIRAGEVAGRLFIFADQYYKRDRFHAQRLLREVPKAHLFNVPRVGHHVARAFAGTQHLKLLLSGVWREDAPALRRFVRIRRRYTRMRLRALAAWAARRRSPFLLSCVAGGLRQHPSLLPHFDAVLTEVAAAEIAAGRAERVAAISALLAERKRGPAG